MLEDQVLHKDVIIKGPPLLMLLASLGVSVEINGPSPIPVAFQIGSVITAKPPAPFKGATNWIHVCVKALQNFDYNSRLWHVHGVFHNPKSEAGFLGIEEHRLHFQTLVFSASYDCIDRTGRIVIGIVPCEQLDTYHLLLKK